MALKPNKNSNKPEDERIFSTIRIKESAAQKVEKQADENRRSLSAQVAFIVEQWAEGI